MLLSLLLACPTCPEGFAPAGGGRCAPDGSEPTPTEEASGDGVDVSMRDCVSGATDGRMDIVNGCADDVCVGMSQDAIVELLGEPEEESGDQWDWAIGINVEWDGTTAQQVEVDEPWVGGTTDGLGPGASIQCFFDALGDADLITAILQADGSYDIWSAAFFDAGVQLFESGALLGDGDEVVDTVLLEGAGN